VSEGIHKFIILLLTRSFENVDKKQQSEGVGGSMRRQFYQPQHIFPRRPATTTTTYFTSLHSLNIISTKTTSHSSPQSTTFNPSRNIILIKFANLRYFGTQPLLFLKVF